MREVAVLTTDAIAAEVAAALLRAEGIACRIARGVFGSMGIAGVGGEPVTIYVAEDRARAARELLDIDEIRGETP